MDTNTTGMGKQIAIWSAVFIGAALIIAGMIYTAKRGETAKAERINTTIFSFAQSLNLNMDQFKNDFESKELKDKIQQRLNEGEQIPITYTPTFFLNGIRIDNPTTPAGLEDLVNKALNGEAFPSSVDGEVKIPNTINADDWVRGDRNSKAVLVEYSDFQCPACGAYYPLVEQVNKEMGTKFAYVYRHFPLVNLHPFAEPMARAAEAAGKQGKFWEMYNLIFTNQAKWSQ